MAESSSIIVCGQRYDVGRRVISFQDDPTISAYTERCISRDCVFPYAPAKGLGQMKERWRPRRLIGTDKTLPRLQQVLKQFVVHHDGMGDSRGCFRVLHDERGLSVHFLLDNNGDIYQTLDLVDCGFQAAGVNEISVGVELCSRGDKLELTPHQTATYKQFPREPVTCTINGHQWLAWSYTKEQFESMVALARTLARLFPGLPQVCPEANGEPIWNTLDGDVREFSGYLGHYHITNNKWDPGPWDFKKFIQNIRGKVFYPSVPGKEKAELPDESEKAEEIAHDLYDNNEVEGEGGYFPVGPMGETRLWHGGSHLRDDRGKPVVAPFAGKIVLARMKKEDDWAPVGSPNFVLIRHELPVAGTPLKFFTLLMHLDEETSDQKMPQWMKSGQSKKWWKELTDGEVVAPEAAVAAGEVIAHFGEAGKPGGWKGQVHFEVFAVDEIGAAVQAGFWKAIDGTRGGRFCAVPEIVVPMDVNKSWTLARSEITYFFQKNKLREGFRKLAVRHLSEWADNNDWEVMLNKARDFAGLSKGQKHKMYEEQIQPFLWWTDGLPDVGLPSDKLVWGYHPITFVLWLHDRMAGQTEASKAILAQTAYTGKKPPAEIKDDAEATDGFMDDEDALFGAAAKSLDLEKLAEGFPD